MRLPSYSIVLTRVPEGYRLSINGEDYIYSSIWDVQSRVAALVWPTPESSSMEVQIYYHRSEANET